MSSSLLKKQIQNAGPSPLDPDTGTVLAAGDGVARIHGLSAVMAGELVEIACRDGQIVPALALQLERDGVGAALFGDPAAIREGDTVKRTGRLMDVPTGEACLGRVLDALGRPIDGKGPLRAEHRARIEKRAPGVVQRRPAFEPLQTGIKAIDLFLPVGRGHSALILGDRGTGKTTLAVDAILAQKAQNVFCIHVAIGKSLSEVRRIAHLLESRDAMEYTTIVAACASEPASLQHLAPFTGTAMAEHFRDTGRHALVVHDDLGRHAAAHRHLSLLLGRLPGRDTYPSDLPHVHARLLDRAGRLAGSGGSLTALAIVETHAGDMSAHLPASLLRMTDARIFLASDLFASGVRPAVDFEISRACGAHLQVKAVRQLTGHKSLLLFPDPRAAAEMERALRLAPVLDSRAHALLDRRARIAELLKQAPHEPLRIEQQALLLFAHVHGLVADLPISDLRRFETDLLSFMDAEHPALLADILSKRGLDEGVQARMKAAILAFEQTFVQRPRG